MFGRRHETQAHDGQTHDNRPDGERGEQPTGPRGTRFLYAGPPTEPVPIADQLRFTPYRDPRVRELPEREPATRQALELAVRVGELQLRCGAGTRDVESSLIAVAAAAGIRRLEVDITNQALLVQAPVPGGAPVTMLRVVRSATKDFARLSAVHRFVDDITDNGIDDLDAASARLKAIQRQTRLYPSWMLIVAFACMAASICALLGGGSTAIVVAAISAVAVDRAESLLNRRGLPPFFVAATGSMISTVLAWAAYVAAHKGFGGQMSRNDFAFAVAAGIVLLLPGRAIASAVEDGITGYPVTGAGRLLTVGLTCAGITVGVALGLSLTLRLDDALDLGLTSPQALRFGYATSNASVHTSVLGATFGALCAAVTMRSQVRHLVPSAILGGIGSFAAYLIGAHLGLGATSAVAAAAVLVGILGRAFALRLGAPALVLVVPAVSPMLPGLRIFRGIYDAVSGTVVGAAQTASSTEAIGTLIGAAGVALAISTGLVLGDALSAPFDRRSLRRRRTARRR